MRRIAAGEGIEGAEINSVQCVFDAGFDNLIAGAVLDAEADPKTLYSNVTGKRLLGRERGLECQYTLFVHDLKAGVHQKRCYEQREKRWSYSSGGKKEHVVGAVLEN